MICPSCKYRYRAGVTVCPDCDIPLVEHLPVSPVATKPDDSWVSVCALTSKGKSEIARGALDSNNIPSVVMAGLLAGDGDTGTGVADPERSELLMVPREFADEAMLIIEAVLGDEFRHPER